jgi:hypothetical protein
MSNSNLLQQDATAWLLAIGQRLRVEYEDLAEPMPPRLTALGVDVQNGRYHGTFMEDGGRIKVTATLYLAEGGTLVTGAQVSPGTKLPLSADWPADFANGSPQQIMVQGSPVQVAFEKVGDIP